MPDNNINSIVKDENNTLWIGTKSGLASKSDVTTFAEKDIEHNSLKIYPNSVNRYLSIKAD